MDLNPGEILPADELSREPRFQNPGQLIKDGEKLLNKPTSLDMLGKGSQLELLEDGYNEWKIFEVIRQEDKWEPALAIVSDQTGRLCMAKIGTNTVNIELVEHEALIMAALNHPNISRVVTLLHNKKDFLFAAMIMELFNQETMLNPQNQSPYNEFTELDELLETDELTLDNMFPILEQLADAIEYMEQKGVFQFDLKPNNIMIQRQPDNQRIKYHPIIFDFGYANEPELSGTEYIPPEARLIYPLGQKTHRDIRGEVFSLAVIASDMLYGQGALFAEQIPTQTTEGDQSVNRLNLSFEQIKRANEVIFKAIRRNPKERYSTPSEFVKELKKAIIED